MALLKATIGRDEGGYTRLFGDPGLGRLLSRVQSAVIRAGAELEQVIIDLARKVDDVDQFLGADIIPEGVYAVPKKQLKKSKTLNYAGVEPDFIIFQRDGRKQHCYLVELKDGDTFDTKKAAGEKDSLQRFLTAVAPHIQFTMSIHFCCFHRKNRQEIVSGFKKKITLQEAMTGREFCELLGIDYDDVLIKRKEHQEENLKFFVEQLLEIDAVKDVLSEVLGFGNVEWDDDGSDTHH
ncbi:MAG TPA: hypothetical protein PKA13_24260 [Geminicoccaceae bacterium]|nr:hypothetical protein [Geminicoccus sp.]HMU52912.1 hypothetical protein [Geminicoccaceae bacterium]